MKRSTLFLLLISSASLIGTRNPLLLGREPKQSTTIVQREGFRSLDLDQKLSEIAARKHVQGLRWRSSARTKCCSKRDTASPISKGKSRMSRRVCKTSHRFLKP